MQDLKLQSIYRHFKGMYVFVYDVAYDSETLKKQVIYRELSNKKLFVRDYDMFLSKVDKQKYPNIKQEYRFEYMKDLSE